MDKNVFPGTPDGRYLVVRGRLWRKSDPSLSDEVREGLVKELMSARRAVKEACGDIDAMREARSRVNDAKTALGERVPVWWSDGTPDCNRRLAINTGYASWYATLKSGLDRR